mmetsp:Transcript_15919/g.44467  ORF Transcript_15919/g.44467 Transcript_15919/m.44467 type:complete len:245 (-) Transcript_15919:924-1658(-)
MHELRPEDPLNVHPQPGAGKDVPANDGFPWRPAQCKCDGNQPSKYPSVAVLQGEGRRFHPLVWLGFKRAARHCSSEEAAEGNVKAAHAAPHAAELEDWPAGFQEVRGDRERPCSPARQCLGGTVPLPSVHGGRQGMCEGQVGVAYQAGRGMAQGGLDREDGAHQGRLSRRRAAKQAAGCSNHSEDRPLEVLASGPQEAGSVSVEKSPEGPRSSAHADRLSWASGKARRSPPPCRTPPGNEACEG